MTADLLRRAATKIRETAQGPCGEGWYDTDELTERLLTVTPRDPNKFRDLARADAAHIALWSPDVAELAASALEGTADLYELLGGGADLGNPAGLVPQAQNRVLFQLLTLARRILGEP